MAIREGVVNVLLYLYDEHDVEEYTLVQEGRQGHAVNSDYHDFLEKLSLLAMMMATDEEIDASYERHEPVEWI
jgi:hypothetical protein